MPVGPVTHGNEPSQVINYSLNLSNSIGDVFDEYNNMYVDERIADALDTADLEHDVTLLAVPKACKEALRNAIKELNSHSSRRPISKSYGSDEVAERLNNDTNDSTALGKSKEKKPLRISFSSSHPLCTTTMGLVVLEGETGSGKEESMLWLKRCCGNRALRMVSMNIFAEERAADYSTIARLFRLLIREENFDDPVRQKLVVETLLRETYPNDPTTREKIAYPTVCHTLRVTWPDRFRRVPSMPPIPEEVNRMDVPHVPAIVLASRSGSVVSRPNLLGKMKKMYVMSFFHLPLSLETTSQPSILSLFVTQTLTWYYSIFTTLQDLQTVYFVNSPMTRITLSEVVEVVLHEVEVGSVSVNCSQIPLLPRRLMRATMGGTINEVK